MVVVYYLDKIRARRAATAASLAADELEDAVSQISHCPRCELPGYVGRPCSSCGDVLEIALERPLWCVEAEARRDAAHRADRFYDAGTAISWLLLALVLGLLGGILVSHFGLHL